MFICAIRTVAVTVANKHFRDASTVVKAEETILVRVTSSIYYNSAKFGMYFHSG